MLASLRVLGPLYGMTLVTDDPELASIVEAHDHRKAHARYPGLADAVAQGHRDLALRRAEPSVITYLNRHVQVHAETRFFVPPSPAVQVLPSSDVPG